MVRRIAIWILAIFILSIFTGCWNNRDLSDLSLLSAFGIDRTEDGKAMVSVQIIKPSSAKGSGTKSSGGGDKKSFVVVSSTSDTVFGAGRGLLSKVGNKTFINSSQIIVLGEGMAKSGIKDYIDFILRDHSIQFKTQVIVAKGTTAKEILEQEYEQYKVPASFILDTLENSEWHAFTKKLMLLEMTRELAAEGKELSIGTIEKVEKSTTTEGLAVFQKDKLVGYLDKFETRGYMYITNQVKKSVIEVKDPEAPKKTVSIELANVSAKTNIKLGKNNIPETNIKIKFSGNIGEQESFKLEESEYVKAVNESLKAKIKEEALKTIEKCQKEYKSDIFGFGMYVFAKYPKYWNKSKDNWNTEIFPNIKVNIEVDGSIERTGLLLKSVEIK